MIRQTENYLTLDQVTAMLPGHPHRSTLWRWAAEGIRGERLKFTKIGGRTFIAESEVQRFVGALSRRPEGTAQ